MERLPPSYSTASPTPIYSTEPGQDEQRLLYRQRTTESRASSRPTGVFVQKQNGITILLNDQEDGAQRPVYGRRANISGTLIIDESEFVSKVSIQATGRLESLSSAHGYVSVDIVDEMSILFDDSSSSRSCPNSLSFSFLLPAFTQNSGQQHSLPPTYYVLLPGESTGAQYVKCAYALKATASRIRSRRATFLGKSHKSIQVEFEYLPRSRPPRPIPQRAWFSTIKNSPEEWRAFTYGIVPQPKYNLAPLSCQLYLPSVGVFGVADSIPFYLQITGPRSTLEKLQQNVNDSEPSQLDTPSEHPAHDRPALSSEPPFRVHLLRQLVFQVNGKKHASHFHLGEGKLCAQSPAATPGGSSAHHGSNENLNWEGEVRCELEEKLSPSFDVGVVSTMDFITLEISKKHKDFFLPFRQSHAVRLVTDSCTDVAGS